VKVDIKVVLLDGQKVTRHLRTPKHYQRLTKAGIEQLLDIEADRLEQFFPGKEFRLVPLRGCAFNFVEIAPELTTETQGHGEANQC
jgi:hypothetical protein